MCLEPTESAFHIAEEADGCTARFRSGVALTDAAVEALGRRFALSRAGGQRLTLDLTGVPALSSGALGKLLALNRAIGGRLTLTHLVPTVRRVLRLTRLDTVLNIRADEPLPT